MKKTYLFGLLAVFILHIQPTFSQNNKFLVASFPIKFIDNNSIYFEAKINNQKTLTFLFDTGASTSLLDKESAQALNINPTFETEVAGAGGNIKYQIAQNQKINIMDIQIDSVDFVLEDLSRLKKAGQYTFDGIIGYSLLKTFITEIDLDQKVINLYPRNAKLNLSAYTIQSFDFFNNINIPQMRIAIELKNGKKLNGRVFFDSGAGLGLLVNTPFSKKHDIIHSTNKHLTSFNNNLSKKSVMQDIAIKKLYFAGYDFQNLPVSLATDEAGVSSFEGYLGIMGADIIYKFNTILNYDTKKIYLKPNTLFALPFQANLTGFSISTNDKKEIYISKISQESPAYKKGIREGDLLISVNNDNSQDITSYRNLLKAEGKKVRLLIKNKTGLKTYKLKLKNLL